MASSAVDLLLGKIVSILENEASLLSGVRDEIIEIKLELNSMRSFLEDVTEKQDYTAKERTIGWQTCET
ncbi:hypothetical protein PTKIN_Ptkin01aG0390900 [Pterospermum kingtungense]